MEEPMKVRNQFLFRIRADACNFTYRSAPRRPCSFAIALVTLSFLILAACHSKTSQSALERYPVTGRVVSIDAQDESAVIDHDKIPGFMDAMTMPYKIKPPSVLSQLAPGDSITAELVQAQPDEDEHAEPIN